MARATSRIEIVMFVIGCKKCVHSSPKGVISPRSCTIGARSMPLLQIYPFQFLFFLFSPYVSMPPWRQYFHRHPELESNQLFVHTSEYAPMAPLSMKKFRTSFILLWVVRTCLTGQCQQWSLNPWLQAGMRSTDWATYLHLHKKYIRNI